MLIIRESFYGATRFEQFHRVLQCPRNLLSERLALLVDERILERSEYREPGSRARMEYRLTDKEGPPVVARHAECGRELQVSFACSEGHIVTEPDEIELVDGPGALPPIPV